MELRKFRTFLVFCTTLLLGVQLTIWKYSEKPNYAFVVKVPKAFNPNFDNAELWEYIESGNELPIDEFKKRNIPIPNICGTLLISLSPKGNIKINSQDIATSENTTPLTNMMSKVFYEREQNGVYEPNSNKVVKVVIIKAPRSAKYGDVAKVIDAVKTSGADPIILQIDDLAE